MGEISIERLSDRKHLPDLSRMLRVPVLLLISVTLFVGCYPNSILRFLRPTFAAPVESTDR